MLLLIKKNTIINLFFFLVSPMPELDQMMRMLDRARLNTEARTANVNVQADANPEHDVADNSVTKSHALSRAYYRFGLVEKRCMEALISKLHPLRSDNNLQEIELSALEYSKAFDISRPMAYRDIARAIDNLIGTVIRVDLGKKIIKLSLMTKAEYVESNGRITCEFNPHIVPHLIGLREKFSSYPLKKAVSFSSSYTWRFYEILVSWAQPKQKTDGRFMGWIDRQSVEELREMLGVPDSYTWNVFEKRVLKVAQAELKEKANMFITFERVKTSRKITHLNIKFIEDDQLQIQLKN